MTRADVTTEPRNRGVCSVCERDFEITRKGVIRHHGSDIWYQGRRQYRCDGAGKPPKESTDGQ
jgi:hypothetical protein